MKLVRGVGVNDADYTVCRSVGGKRVFCPIYVMWTGMLTRCYSDKYKAKNPTYHGCSVDCRWHSFMSFREWVLSQDYHGNVLDKDILVEGNKVYSPETCVFISVQLNAFIRPSKVSGATLYRTGKFISQCNGEFLGYFTTRSEAEEAYLTRKREIAIYHAGQQKCAHVASKIIERFVEN